MKKEDAAPTPMRYAFVDESGTAAPFSGGRFFVVSLLATLDPRRLELITKREQKRQGASLVSGEMKASASDERLVGRFLATLATEEIDIVAIAIDKAAILRPPQDPESLYREALCAAIRQAVQRWPRLSVTLDKRYTNKRLTDRLEEELRAGIADLHQEIIIIRQEDSVRRKGLQAADHIAWAIFQKYERGVNNFYDAIAPRLLIEELMCRALW